MYRAQVGYPIGYFYGFKTAGVFQNQAQIDSYTGAKYEGAQPGDLIWVDTNEDGVINNDDRTMIGDPNPHFTAGLNFWMAWKGFDFNIAGYGAFGHQVAKSYRSFADSQRDNFTTEVFQTWQGEGTSNKYPRLTYGSNPNWQNISDIYIENGDYFKISRWNVIAPCFASLQSSGTTTPCCRNCTRIRSSMPNGKTCTKSSTPYSWACSRILSSS